MSEAKAEAASLAATDEPDRLLERFDPAAQRALRLAAEIGLRSKAEIPVTFTSLLAAVIFVAPGARELIARQRLPVRFDEILSELGTSPSGIEDYAKGIEGPDGGVAPWPSVKQSLTRSAVRMVDSAHKTALRRGGPDTQVSVQDLLVAFLSDVPSDHEARIMRWGFTPDAVSAISTFLAARAPLPDDAVVPALRGLTKLPGFDAGASAILRLGHVLARHRTTAVDPPNTASTLLVAMIDAEVVTPGLPEIAALRDNVGAETDDSKFAVYRRRAYQQLSDPVSLVASDAAEDAPAESPGLRSVQEEAKAIAALTTAPDVVVAPRHLAAALILTRTGEINEQSDDLKNRRGLNDDTWRWQLRDVIARHYPGDNQPAWARVLAGARLVAAVQPDTIPSDPRGSDALGLRRYSDALAALISAEKLQPPLSIAVFGAWGSGKSFFMRMIRRAIDDFSDEGKLPAGTAPALFLDGVVHIDFNAWHYAEENLWASLVQAILVGVQTQLSPKPPQPVFKQVLDNLVEREQAEFDAKRRLETAEQNLQRQRANLANAEIAASQRRVEQAHLAAEDVITPLRQLTIGYFRPPDAQADPASWIRSISQSVVEAADFIGRPELADNLPELRRAAEQAADTQAALAAQIGEVQSVVDQIRGSERRGVAFLSWLARQQMDRHERRLLLARVLPWLGLLLVVTLWAFWFVNQVVGTVSLVTSLVLPAIVGAKPVLGWMRRRLADADKAFAVLEDLRARIEKEREQRLAVHDGDLNIARQLTTEAEAAATRERVGLETASYEVAAAREAVRMASGVEQMKRFIGQRLDDGDYLRRLGLIHTISIDLQRLQSLLRQIAEEPAGRGSSGATVRRVVLYIDDLDRCPPKRVVEVLEAVHLLLAFELFVVVVGVDIRWVEEALKSAYPKQLTGTGGIASPMDYLEKVFQIPFWLPPMDAAGGASLLAAAIGPVSIRRPVTETSRAAPSSVAGESLGGAQRGGNGPEPLSQRSQGQVISGGIAAAVAAEALQITGGELEQMRSLAAAVGISPRRAKRFANLYRVLKASLSVQERAVFVMRDGAAGSYRAAMILLALTTGAPHAAAGVLNRLADIADSDPASAGSLDHLLIRTRASRDERPAFAAAAAAIQQEVGEASDAAAAIEMFRFWAPRVRRFAFDVGRA